MKYGGQRGPDGNFVGVDTSPAGTKAALAYSLTRLGVDHIDIYRPAGHRLGAPRARRRE